MKDKLDIKDELFWVVATWSFFDFFQYVFYFLTQLSSCSHSDSTLGYLISHAPLFSYVTIITRDFATHLVMVYFIVKVNRRESNIKAELEREDSPHDLLELKTVLNSCRPLMSFGSYLEDKKPNHLVLLEYIKIYETIREKVIDLEDLQSKRSQAESVMQSLCGQEVRQDVLKTMK